MSCVATSLVLTKETFTKYPDQVRALIHIHNLMMDGVNFRVDVTPMDTPLEGGDSGLTLEDTLHYQSLIDDENERLDYFRSLVDVSEEDRRWLDANIDSDGIPFDWYDRD